LALEQVSEWRRRTSAPFFFSINRKSHLEMNCVAFAFLFFFLISSSFLLRHQRRRQWFRLLTSTSHIDRIDSKAQIDELSLPFMDIERPKPAQPDGNNRRANKMKNSYGKQPKTE